MIDRYQDVARAFLAVLWLAMVGAAAQAKQPSLNQPANSTSPTPSAAPQAPAAQPPARSAAPQVNTASPFHQACSRLESSSPSFSLRWNESIRTGCCRFDGSRRCDANLGHDALAGYLALSRFLTRQLIVTGSILALVYLLVLWVDGFAQGLGDDSAATGYWLKERAGLEQRRREQLALPIGLFLKFAVLVLSVPLNAWSGSLRRRVSEGAEKVEIGAFVAALELPGCHVCLAGRTKHGGPTMKKKFEIAVLTALLAAPLAAQAQGIPGGMGRGAAEGNAAAA